MHWKNLANYDYLGAYSLEGKKDIILTIKDIKKERVTAPGGSSEDCIVARFVETNVDGVTVKPMVLNKTNCKTIEKLYNSGDIEDWIGKKVTVYATTTKFARETVSCLRIKAEIPQEPVYNCAVCGKVIDKKTYAQSTEKYGVALCSAECKDKFVTKELNEENKGE